MKTNWNTTAAPKNGTVIHARGKVMERDEFSTCAQPFEALIFWRADEDSGWAGWVFHHNRLAVASTLEDEVIIHEWLPLFAPVKVAGHTINELRSKGYRAQMRAYALRFREAIHPGENCSFGHRVSQGVHFLDLAMYYRGFAASAIADGYEVRAALAA